MSDIVSWLLIIYLLGMAWHGQNDLIVRIFNWFEKRRKHD